jgi:uncharacterized protein YraI
MHVLVRRLGALVLLGLGASLVPLLGTGCAAASGGGDASDQLVGANENGDDDRGAQSMSGPVAAGATLATTANVNLRTGAGTGFTILHVIPSGALVTVVDGTPKSGWYNIKHAGAIGWSYGVYLSPSGGTTGGGGTTTGGGGTTTGGGTTGGTTSGGSSTRDDAITRAKEGVGFSYWWGHGRWLPSGPSASTAGSCSGSCPSCSHGGSYGADCSGYVAKIWQVPSSNSDITSDSHPYSTYNFANETTSWHVVDRGSVKTADAMTYNSGGSGHVFLYESGDGWGSMWTYEARGCAYGIVHNVRTASTAYKGIARNGW